MRKKPKKKPVKKTKAEKNARSFAVVLVKIAGKDGDEYYVQANDDDKNSVAGYDSVHAGVASIERAYERSHARGYEASMSACINWMYFQRAVVGLASVEDLRKTLLPDVPDDQLRLVTLSHVSGFMTGIRADTKKAAKAWKTAEHPRLKQDV